MWRDFDLTQRIITLKEQETKADIHSKSDFNSAVERASGSHWTPVVTVPRPFSMTIREDALKTTKTQGEPNFPKQANRFYTSLFQLRLKSKEQKEKEKNWKWN